jgi:uncharacterized protein
MALSNPMIFINLPVSNIDASITFYKALGFTQNPKFTGPGGTMVSIGAPHPANPPDIPHPASTINLMLLSHDFFKSFFPTDLDGNTSMVVADAKKATGMMLCLSAGSREEVDEFLEKAKGAGAHMGVLQIPEMEGCYGGSFLDLDGHVWEVMWMSDKAAQGEEAPKPKES